METTSRRPWETQLPPSLPQTTQTLPSIASLTSKLPAPLPERAPSDLSINPPQRDSGSWMTPGTLSGSSAHSTNSMPYLNSAHSPTGPGHSPFTPDHPSAPPAPFSSATQHQSNGLPPPTVDQNAHRGSGDFDDSRRSSVTNSIHHGMNNLGLGPTLPYTSNNASQTSLVSDLQRERGIQTNGYHAGRYSTMNGSMSSFNSNRGGRSFAAGRVAPPILENPKQEVYSAEAPTRGQAYAFPDPDAPRGQGRPPSNFSRRNSFAESFTSSVLTVESSRLPLGQQELPETHHHSLQHRQLDSVRGDPDSPNGTTPYSRTPELRVTHKLAERKRRSEMKDCFEQLRSRLPASQNNKSSKWETLSRAIDYITQLENQNKQNRAEYESQRQKIAELEAKMHEMSQQMRNIQQPQGSFPPPPNAMPQSPMGYGSHFNGHLDGPNESARTLPPIMNSSSMQGIQYSDERR
ncbi:Basic helix-loop-helix transcription factor devR [Exophiala dermatitidis]